MIGTLVGYQARTWLVKALKGKDVFVAVPEDLIAVGLAFLFVSLGYRISRASNDVADEAGISSALKRPTEQAILGQGIPTSPKYIRTGVPSA